MQENTKLENKQQQKQQTENKQKQLTENFNQSPQNWLRAKFSSIQNISEHEGPKQRRSASKQGFYFKSNLKQIQKDGVT